MYVVYVQRLELKDYVKDLTVVLWKSGKKLLKIYQHFGKFIIIISCGKQI